MGTGETLKQFWQARSARERIVLLAASVLIAAAALYALLWEPGLEARKKLGAALPKLRAQVEDMRAQQKVVLALRKNLAPAGQNADLRGLLRASVERSPHLRSVERIEWRASDQVLVAAAAVDFDRWLEWLHGLQAEFGVRMDSGQISALAEPGMVRVEATFVSGAGARPRGAP